MQTEHLDYTNRLYTLGEMTVEAKKLLMPADEAQSLPVTDIPAYQELLKHALSNYEQAKNELEEVSTPLAIQKEHTELLGHFDSFIESFSLLADSLEFEKLNPSLYEKGLALEKVSETGVKKLIKSISGKLKT